MIKRMIAGLLFVCLISLTGCAGEDSMPATLNGNSNTEYEDSSNNDYQESSEGSDKPITSEISEISGIIVAVWDGYKKDRVEIFSVDSETGETKLISSFPNTYGNWSVSRYCTDRELFSSDYKKLVASKYINNNSSCCAGWIDENGNFYNVTEALGLSPKSDFSEGSFYHAVGFIGEYFVYLDDNGRDANGQCQCYAVPMDNISAENIIKLSVDMDEFVPSVVRESFQANRSGVHYWHNFNPSDILDDGRIIIGESIYNSKTGESTSFIPGGSRTNWDGLANPSNDKICFLSMQGLDDETGLYIVDISGGEPIKINCNLPASVKYNTYSGIAYEIATVPNPDKIVCSIVDWK